MSVSDLFRFSSDQRIYAAVKSAAEAGFSRPQIQRIVDDAIRDADREFRDHMDLVARGRRP